MDGSIFNAIDRVVAAAGSTNGHEIAAYLHIEEVTHAGPFVGYSMRIGFYTTISVCTYVPHLLERESFFNSVFLN